MGKALVLDIPAEEQTEQTIESYYKQVLETENNYRDQPKSLDDDVRYKNAKSRLRQRGEVRPLFSLSRTIVEGIGRDRFNALFDLHAGSYQRTVLRDDEICELKTSLETAYPRLTEIKPTADWELSLAEPIVMCEFAYRNGYNIELSY